MRVAKNLQVPNLSNLKPKKLSKDFEINLGTLKSWKKNYNLQPCSSTPSFPLSCAGYKPSDSIKFEKKRLTINSEKWKK